MAATSIAFGAIGTVEGRASGRRGRSSVPTTGIAYRAPARQELPHTIHLEALTQRVEYHLAVSGQIELGPESGDGDEIRNGSTVEGRIHGEGAPDDYRFSGQITAFEITSGDARVTVNGGEVDDPVGLPEGEPTTELPHTIALESLTRRVEYRLEVSGTIQFGPEAGENDEINDGNSVDGVIDGKGAPDDYRFSGRITSFELHKGDARVSVNGREVDDPVGLPDRQAQECVEIRPLRYRNQTVTEFYGYTPDLSAPDPRQSNTPTDLERPGVSRLFLFEGPEGLSLVIIHGGGAGEEGGAASFEISGLPADGEWAVLDDGYEGSGDVFEIGDTTSSMHWAWGVAGRNDGGAFRGLGDEFQIRIEPSFDEDARLEPFGSGEVTEWQVLSGSATNPDVIPVPVDEPLVVATGRC